jgi:hypothetical protein
LLVVGGSHSQKPVDSASIRARANQHHLHYLQVWMEYVQVWM